MSASERDTLKNRALFDRLTGGLVAICLWAIREGHEDIAYNYARALGNATTGWFRIGGTF